MGLDKHHRFYVHRKNIDESLNADKPVAMKNSVADCRKRISGSGCGQFANPWNSRVRCGRSLIISRKASSASLRKRYKDRWTSLKRPKGRIEAVIPRLK